MGRLAQPADVGVAEPRLAPFIQSVAATIREIARDRVALTAATLLVLIISAAILAPLLAPHDPGEIDILERLQPPLWAPGGSLEYPLGTDQLGRDVLSRLIYGSRVSLIVATCVVALAGLTGTILGVMAGYRGGRTDDIIMRLADIQTAFPGMLLVLLTLTIIGPGLVSVILVLTMTGWMVFARMARGQVLALREQQFLESAMAVGCTPRRIMFSHVAPNIASAVLTLAALETARVILVEAVLSFLGVGIQPPATSWGLMIAEGQTYLTTASWLVTLPGLAIATTVMAVNVVAGWLRTHADPTQRYRRGGRLAE
jgi:peptide/nickel transport system permease protein